MGRPALVTFVAREKYPETRTGCGGSLLCLGYPYVPIARCPPPPRKIEVFMTDLAIAGPPVKRKRPPRSPPKQRFLTLDALDERTTAYNQAIKLIKTLATDMGGDDQLSEGERQLVTRAALVGAIVADFETRWISGQQIPLSEYLSAVNVQRRVLATLGLERRQKDVTGFGAARMIEHEQTMREEAAKREQRPGDVFVPAADPEAGPRMVPSPIPSESAVAL